MSSGINWGKHEDADRDFLGTPADRALFDEPHHWDPVDHPHPNRKLMNNMADFGKKYINYDATPAKTETTDTYNSQRMFSNTPPKATESVTQAGTYSYKVPEVKNMPAYKAPDYSVPVTKPDSFTQALDSVNAVHANTATATPDFLKAATRGYLKHGQHDNAAQSQKKESTATADFLRETVQGTGNMMMNSGSDKAAHDSETNFNLHFSQNPEEYAQWINKGWKDSGNAAIRTDTEQDRHLIDTYGDDTAIGGEYFMNGLENGTLKTAMLVNQTTFDEAEKYKRREVIAKEMVENNRKWNDINSRMMTAKDIRRNTPENTANDTFKYLYQTGLSRHFVNLAMLRAYRGTPFMMDKGVDILDASMDIYADNIHRKGDHNYINALKQSINENHPTKNDVLISAIAYSMGGPTGDALQFFWDTSTQAQKNQMMKEVYKRQQERMQAAVIGGGAATYNRQERR